MKLAIMQPYFLPYIGYWQLMNYADKYVVYDDVNYIKGGWINRNRIIVNDSIAYINIPLMKSSQNKTINEIYIDRNDRFIKKELRKVELSYAKAAYFKTVYPLCEKIFRYDGDKLVDFIMHSFIILKEYMGIDTEIILSSEIKKDNELKGEKKIIDICKRLKATQYINSIGGKQLYVKEQFESNGIQLSFIKTKDIRYNQGTLTFHPNMSILDIIMNVEREQVKNMLKMYQIDKG